MSYTDGYNEDSQFLPYPHQVDLPDVSETTARLVAVKEWLDLAERNRHVSRQLPNAWKEEHRLALMAEIDRLDLFIKRSASKGMTMPEIEAKYFPNGSPDEQTDTGTTGTTGTG